MYKIFLLEIAQEVFWLGAGVCASLRSFTRLKLNWKKAADKGALCGTRAGLIHAEELVSQVGALSRGKKPPKILSNFPDCLQHFCCMLCWWELVSPPGVKRGEAGQAA